MLRAIFDLTPSAGDHSLFQELTPGQGRRFLGALALEMVDKISPLTEETLLPHEAPNSSDMEKRVCHITRILTTQTGYMLGKGLFTLMLELCTNEQNMFIWYYSLAKCGYRARIDLIDLNVFSTQIVPRGYPTDLAFKTLWDEQVVDGVNTITLPQTWAEICNPKA